MQPLDPILQTFDAKSEYFEPLADIYYPHKDNFQNKKDKLALSHFFYEEKTGCNGILEDGVELNAELLSEWEGRIDLLKNPILKMHYAKLVWFLKSEYKYRCKPNLKDILIDSAKLIADIVDDKYTIRQMDHLHFALDIALKTNTPPDPIFQTMIKLRDRHNDSKHLDSPGIYLKPVRSFLKFKLPPTKYAENALLADLLERYQALLTDNSLNEKTKLNNLLAVATHCYE
jgi:hypothetical protein